MNEIYLIIVESGEGISYTQQCVGYCVSEDKANQIRDQIKNSLLNNRLHYVNYDNSINEAIMINNEKVYLFGAADCVIKSVKEIKG